MKAFVISCSVVLILLLQGCANTKMRDTWQAEDFDAKNFNHVLVVAVSDNISSRLIFESEFVRELQDRGVDAKASNKAIGNSKPSKEKLVEYLKTNRADYVLVSRLIDIEVTKDYVRPTTTIYSTGGHYYPGFYGNWNMMDNTSTIITTEGYMDTSETTILETTIYSAKTQGLVWAGKSATFEAGSVSEVAKALAKLTLSNIK